VLALTTRGPSPSAALLGTLGVSQPTFSRLVSRHENDLLVVGRGPATRYALRRDVPDVGGRIPVYDVLEDGGARRLCVLHAVAPDGFFVKSIASDVDERFHEDLPYFLNDLRPSGFLGRLIPRLHPELGLPPDINHWSSTHTLLYWTKLGWNLPGALIVGEEAFRRHLDSIQSPNTVSSRQRRRLYPALADDVLAHGPIGSSAAGEQPKFLISLSPGPKHVLVKFSPRRDGPVARRLADLLVAEHVAHETLGRHGQRAVESRLLEAGQRLFLEVDRFDRTPQGGRRGVLSLLSLDAELVGRLRSWTETVELLCAKGRLAPECADRVRWLERFGQLIANTDRHFANLSLFARGERVGELTPCYDMVPMLYAPQHGHLPERAFTPPTPGPDDADLWASVCAAARDFWQRVAEHPLVTSEFTRIARANGAIVGKVAELSSRLPS
jgi:hypothetical protein